MPLPILPIIQGGAGLVQSLIGGGKARKAQKQLEAMQSPTYVQNKGVMDYYNTALQRYNVSPTDSAMYKRQMRDVNRGVASSLQALDDRRSGIAGASSILRAANDASLNANAAAEQEKSRRFGELGGATQMKVSEDDKAFQQNELAPFERKYNLLSMKAGGANQTANAGLSNIFGGLQNAMNYQLYNKEFGSGNTRGQAGNSRTGRVTRSGLLSAPLPRTYNSLPR